MWGPCTVVVGALQEIPEAITNYAGGRWSRQTAAATPKRNHHFGGRAAPLAANTLKKSQLQSLPEQIAWNHRRISKPEMIEYTGTLNSRRQSPSSSKPNCDEERTRESYYQRGPTSTTTWEIDNDITASKTRAPRSAQPVAKNYRRGADEDKAERGGPSHGGGEKNHRMRLDNVL